MAIYQAGHFSWIENPLGVIAAFERYYSQDLNNRYGKWPCCSMAAGLCEQ